MSKNCRTTQRSIISGAVNDEGLLLGANDISYDDFDVIEDYGSQPSSAERTSVLSTKRSISTS
jgi:hypothetical protein